MKKVRLPELVGEAVAIRRAGRIVTALGVVWPDGSRALVPSDVAIHWLRFGRRGFYCQCSEGYASLTGVEQAIVNAIRSDNGLFELRTPDLVPFNGLL